MKRLDAMSILDDRAFMRLHVEAEFTHDAAGRMLRVNEPEGKDAPRFFLGRTAHGNEWRFRHDVDRNLASELEAACVSEPTDDSMLLPPYGVTRYEELLTQQAPIARTWAGPAYRFPDELPAATAAVLVTSENAELLSPHLEPWLGDIALGRLVLALVDGGRAVSLCGSVRVTEQAHEAGVDTAPEFRGRGYAPIVVAAWARVVRDLGRIPLYSTSWENTASQAVARKLGLIRFGSDLHIT